MYKKLILVTLVFATMLHAANLNSKDSFQKNENVIIDFADMVGKNQDWIGIYPKESNNDWGNIVSWKWTNDTENGNLDFGVVPVGSYEARAFYNNSFKVEASKEFKVVKNKGVDVDGHIAINTSKKVYDVNEPIHVNFAHMAGKNRDWIGIYPEDSNNDWANILTWKWTNDLENGDLDFDVLPVGSYEVRAFYNNSFKVEGSKKFKVKGNAINNAGPDHILYDDMENGLNPRWVKYAGRFPAQIINQGAQGSIHSFRARAYSGFYFDFEHPAEKLKFLEIDTRIGAASHVGNFGVLVKTRKGNRRIIFSSYMNHPGNHFGVPPEQWDKPTISENGYQHNHPGPTDFYLDTRNGNFIHYKINIDEKLKILEPDNKVLSILLFTTSGGDFDNLALSAN